MNIAVASDHAGFPQKDQLIAYTRSLGAEVTDFGPASGERVDYPDYAQKVAHAVAEGRADRGILLCGTGLGMALTADKVPGVRAVAVQTPEFSHLAREHNDANIICLSARFVDPKVNEEIIKEFLTTDFAGGRHAVRVEKMMKAGALEEGAAHAGAASGAKADKETSYCDNLADECGAHNRLVLVDHPLVQHKMAILRDEKTGTKQFRELIRELALFEGYEATRDFPLEDIEVSTPLEKTQAKQIAGKKVAIVPILRAGLGMVDGLLDLLPTARVGHIGMYRDPQTKEPQPYYCKLPGDIQNRTVLLVDPMLATGGSANAAIDYLREAGVKDVRLLVIDAAPEGVKAVLDHDAHVRLYTTSLDRKLNDHAYILPGLGDAGDRIFGTL